MLPCLRKSSFDPNAMFANCGQAPASMSCWAFPENMVHYQPTLGMSVALIEMVLSSFEPIGMATCRLGLVLPAAVLTRLNSHATLYEALLGTEQTIVKAFACWASEAGKLETIGGAMEWARQLWSLHCGSYKTSLSSDSLYEFGWAVESMHC
jgi:hypothetical protein